MNKLHWMTNVRRPNSCRKYGDTIETWIFFVCNVLIDNKDYLSVLHTSLQKYINKRISHYTLFIYISVNILKIGVSTNSYSKGRM